MAMVMEPPARIKTPLLEAGFIDPEPDPTALDAIEAAGLTADAIFAAYSLAHAAPTDPMETRMQGLELRMADLEQRHRELQRRLAEVFDGIKITCEDF